jgi:hypothetical protein
MVEEVKKYLKIYSSREDDEIERMIGGGKAYLKGLAGPNINYETDDFAKQLLFDYCRYVYNGSFEFFESNFRSKLIRLQLSEATKSFKGEVD